MLSVVSPCLLGFAIGLTVLAACSSTGHGCDDLSRDPAYCSGSCSLPNAFTSCLANHCELSACVHGFADCNADAKDGCETNLGSDALNCGACGNACTSCSDGACQRVEIIASGQTEPPRGIRVDGSTLAWISGGANGALFTSALDGTNVRMVAATAGATGALALDATSVYWTSQRTLDAGGRLFTTSRAGDAGAAVLALEGEPTRSLAAVSGTAFWIAASASLDGGTAPTGALFSVRNDGGGLQDLASVDTGSLQDGRTLAIVDGDLFWIETGQAALWQLPIGGGDASIVQKGRATGNELSVDATRFYWTTSGNNRISLTVLDRGGAAVPRDLWTGEGSATGLALDDAFLYVAAINAADNGEIIRINKSSGQSLVLAGLRVKPSAIAVNDQYVFWTEGDSGSGSVARLRK
jgi:hypothetical protein